MPRLRFAEDMMLNAKVYPLEAGMRHSQGKRCALGLVEDHFDDNFVTRVYAEQKYPWIHRIVVKLPCPCFAWELHTPTNIIAHLFDHHVMTDDCEPRWTMEQLADWIDKVDPTPREPSPELQTFLKEIYEREVEHV